MPISELHLKHWTALDPFLKVILCPQRKSDHFETIILGIIHEFNAEILNKTVPETLHNI